MRCLLCWKRFCLVSIVACCRSFSSAVRSPWSLRHPVGVSAALVCTSMFDMRRSWRVPRPMADYVSDSDLYLPTHMIRAWHLPRHPVGVSVAWVCTSMYDMRRAWRVPRLTADLSVTWICTCLPT